MNHVWLPPVIDRDNHHIFRVCQACGYTEEASTLTGVWFVWEGSVRGISCADRQATPPAQDLGYTKPTP